jgi:hypothetical protein
LGCLEPIVMGFGLCLSRSVSLSMPTFVGCMYLMARSGSLLPMPLNTAVPFQKKEAEIGCYPVTHLEMHVEKAPNARQEIMLLDGHLLNCLVVEHRKELLFPGNRITNQLDQLRPGCQNRL